MKSLLLGLFILSLALPGIVLCANDAPKWYQIEIILFNNNDSKAVDSEIWPDDIIVKEYKNNIELVISQQNLQSMSPHPEFVDSIQDPQQAPIEKPLDEPMPYQIINPRDYRLGNITRKLRQSPQYDILLHTGWVQPALAMQDDAAVFLYQDMFKPVDAAESQYDQEDAAYPPNRQYQQEGYGYQNEYSQKSNSSTYRDASQMQPMYERSEAGYYESYLPITQSDYQTGPFPQRFYGTVKLSLSRYLHAKTDMVFRKRVPWQEVHQTIAENAEYNDEGQPKPEFVSETVESGLAYKDFLLKESRRIRPGETHYFDHPMFGLIINVSRYKSSE